MAVLAGPLHGGIVVFAHEQVQIPDLGLSGHEQLNGPGQKHLPVVLTQGAVVGGVDLVIHIFLAVEVLHIAAPAHHGIDEPCNALLVQQPLQIQQRNAVVAAQHIHGANLLFHQFIDPFFQIYAAFALHGINDQARQEEIIDHIALGGQQLVGFLPIAGVNLRQQGQAQRLGNVRHPVQQLPGAGVVQEVPLPHLLRCIGKGIQPDDGRAVACQGFQGSAVVIPHQG